MGDHIDAKLLHDLILASTKANESITNSLNTISDSLDALVDSSTKTQAFIEETRTEKKTFYQYTVKTFVWVFAILVFIIGGLLWQLNVNGAETVVKAPATVLKLMN